MAEVDGVVGQGFLDANGRVKSRDTIQREDAAAEKARVSPASAEDAATAGPTLERALRQVGANFNEKANRILSNVSRQQDTVKEAQSVVSDQIAVAKDLKQAIKDGDEDAVQAKKAEFAELEKRRAELAERADSSNRELRTADRSLALGNQLRASVTVREVEFDKTANKGAELDSIDGINSLIDNLQSERDGLATQRSELRDTRREVRRVVKEVDRDLTRIQENPIRDFESATREANKLAESLRSAGSQAVLFNNISASVATRLLS